MKPASSDQSAKSSLLTGGRQTSPPQFQPHEHEDFFRVVSDGMVDLIAVVDKNGYRVYNSPSYLKVLGDPATLVGTNSFQEIHPSDRPKIQRIFRKTFKTGIGQRAEYRFLLPDGSVRHIESQGSVIRDKEGKPLYVVIVSRDVTERKHLEQEMVEIAAREQRKITQGFYERLGQDLTGVGFMGKILEQALAEKSLPEAAQAAEIVKFVAQAVNQTRHLSQSLLSIDLQLNGLSTALKELAANLSRLFMVSCHFHENGTVQIKDSDMTLHLYRIAEEAMNDAVKNRRATRLIVALSAKKGIYELTLTDNGLDRTSRETRIGLKLINYRANFIGVEVEVRDQPQGGRVLKCLFSDKYQPKLV